MTADAIGEGKRLFAYMARPLGTRGSAPVAVTILGQSLSKMPWVSSCPGLCHFLYHHPEYTDTCALCSPLALGLGVGTGLRASVAALTIQGCCGDSDNLARAFYLLLLSPSPLGPTSGCFCFVLFLCLPWA